MVSKLIKILVILLPCFLKDCLSETCSSDPLKESNNVWIPTNEEAKIEENTVKCECCIAVSYVLHTSFESAHRNRPDTIGKLAYPDIIDITGKSRG